MRYRSKYSSVKRRPLSRPSNSPLRQGSYRALAATANHFARESMMNELALAAQLDRLEFRLRNLAQANTQSNDSAVAANAVGAGRVAAVNEPVSSASKLMSELVASN